VKHLLPGAQVSSNWLFGLAWWLSLACSAGAGPYGLHSRPAIGAFLDGAMPETAPGISGDWSAVVAFPHLWFTNAVGFTAVPGTDKLCVWEREGRVWLFEDSPAVSRKTLALDLSRQCQGWDDSGLLGIAFHPGFATNHCVFVYYTWCPPGRVAGSPTVRPPATGNYHDRLSRYTLDAHGIAVPGSEVVFVDLKCNTIWHHGGGMLFHPKNGFLYWTDGDNANGDNDQVINKSLFSGVFRIDVDCRGGSISHPIQRQPRNGTTAHYFIPNDNPFVGQSNVLEEFFCLGLRSPHRMTCDPVTGRLFIGDVGESAREEVDVIEPGESGLNFQWNRCEARAGLSAQRRPGCHRRLCLPR
jgi:glucose/arabinose dehydrogenase